MIENEFLNISFYKKAILFIMSQSESDTEDMSNHDEIDQIVNEMLEDYKDIKIDETERVVVATYSVKSVFKIPDALDLENEFLVKNWYVKWDKLHIVPTFQDEMYVVEPTIHAMAEDALKYPDDVELEDASEYWM